MNLRTVVILGMILSFSALLLTAQSGQSQGRGGPSGNPIQTGGPECLQPQGSQPLPPAVAKMLDWNHDGVISRNEITSAGEIIGKLDANRDGQVSREEICPAQPGQATQDQASRQGKGRGQGRGQGQGRSGGVGPPSHAGQGLLISLFDADGDGVLSKREITKAPSALRRCDVNQDGVVSGDEIRSAGLPGGGNRGGGRGGGRGPR